MRDEMKKVSAQDIMRVAQKYLTPENRTVAELVRRPRAPGARPPGVQVPDTATTAAEAIRTADEETTK
jgi:predicted Zn-dependent peptidase